MKTHHMLFSSWACGLLFLASVAGCGDTEPVSEARYSGPDQLFALLDRNVAGIGALEKIASIDHSRLGATAGSIMPPARVLIFSNPQLDALLMAIDPMIAVDLPLRVLAFEAANGDSSVIYNSFEYLQSRYGLGDRPELKEMFEANMTAVLQGIDPARVAAFKNDSMQPNGITTLTSPFDFAVTVERLVAAIDAQDDTVWFGQVDFQARALEQGVNVEPSLLLLFGAPGPGAKAMSGAPTLGLDAFCQKLLVWQDPSGTVSVSFNDLLAIAERQEVSKSAALRVINHRLGSTFKAALEP